MAVELALGAAVSELSSAIIHVANDTSQFKNELTELQDTIMRIDESGTQSRSVLETETFIDQMKRAEALVQKCKHIKYYNFFRRYIYTLKLKRVNASMLKFFQIDVPLAILGAVEIVKDVGMRMMKGGLSSSMAPFLKGDVIGFEDRLRVLKANVLENSIVVVSAAGGFGKTTLATMLCHDPEIKAKFGTNIYFATISETENLIKVIKNLLPKDEADSVNDDEKIAINQWGSFLIKKKTDNILLVLDDVWSDSIINKFQFKLHGYKILATSRTSFDQFKTYQLQLLNQKDATKLFTYSAFSEGGNNYIPDDLVDEFVKCCRNHPLSLSVIGGSLKGARIERWHYMLEKLSDGQQSVLDLNESIERCLQRSLDVFEENSVIRQCFLDLGLFPEDQKISAMMLMDMWVHLYSHGEDGLATINHIFELSYRNLATLSPIGENSSKIDNWCEERTITQHDLMRTLSIRLSSQEPLEMRKRLIINANGQDLPQLPHTVNALLLSISTDERFSFKWNNIQAPKVEVFVLNSMSKIYPLPQFMQTMEKLKVLIITSYGYNFSNIQNFPSPQYLTGLTTIRLDHVSVSSISTSILELPNLRKLSLIMCQIGNSFNEYIPNKLTSLLEIDIDSCDDLTTFPLMFCNLISLRKLSVTNCHELSSLTEEFGNLINLEVLRLASCTSEKFEELPESLRNLQKLEVFDISECLHLKKLPARIGELVSLRTIHMRGCKGLCDCELPSSVNDLGQLEVFCNEEISCLWSEYTNVKVLLVEEDIIGTFSKITQNDLHVR